MPMLQQMWIKVDDNLMMQPEAEWSGERVINITMKFRAIVSIHADFHRIFCSVYYCFWAAKNSEQFFLKWKMRGGVYTQVKRLFQHTTERRGDNPKMSKNKHCPEDITKEENNWILDLGILFGSSVTMKS